MSVPTGLDPGAIQSYAAQPEPLLVSNPVLEGFLRMRDFHLIESDHHTHLATKPGFGIGTFRHLILQCNGGFFFNDLTIRGRGTYNRNTASLPMLDGYPNLDDHLSTTVILSQMNFSNALAVTLQADILPNADRRAVDPNPSKLTGAFRRCGPRG
jgi:hypothetical protein